MVAHVSSPRVRSSAAGWISFRNILVALITMQIIVLIAIGCSAPSEIERSLGDLFRGPILASFNNQVRRHKKIKSLDSSPKLWKKLAEQWEQVGRFDTQGAFTMNFLPERMHPSFRQAIPEFDSIVARSVKKVKMFLPGEKIKACRYHEMYGGSIRVLRRDACRAPNSAEIVAYNTLPFDRTWCGKNIKAHSIQRYETICDGAVQLSDMPLPPIRLLQTGSHAEPKPIHCSTPCQVANEECDKGDCLSDVTNWIVEDTDLKITYSMLTTSQNGNLKVDFKAPDKYLATRSFQSDIPLSYFDWSNYGSRKPMPPVKFDKANGTSFFKSRGCNELRGKVWAHVMAEHTRLDSYGTCLHNADLPKGMSLDSTTDRESLMKKHLFHLVIDSTQDPDVVDGAVWEALRAGVIPVYYGATNIKDHVPPNSILSAADYGTKIATAERINEIANDRALWESYHEWRKHPFPAELKAKFDFLRASPFCRMCRWSYAKKYGLGWNHTRQQVIATVIGGRPCFCRNGALMSPFLETWLTPTLSRGGRGTCNYLWPNNATIKDSDMVINRTALQHDGVIDLRVEEVSHAEEELVVRMEFAVQNSGGAYFANVHRLLVPSDMAAPLMTSVAIQDDYVRVTVVCDWPTRAWSPSKGIIQIAVQNIDEAPLLKDETRTIRVIPEGVDPLRHVRTEYSLSPFAKRMIEDFSKPLELFLIQS